jgi:GR25 family glycosyltransferase involved in LPS biosynthesis
MAERVDKKAEISIIGRYFNLDIEFIPGVKGTDVAIVKEEGRLQNELGCHRAHTNIWLKMVQEDISSALIFEDDNDFDVDIRHQLGLVQGECITFVLIVSPCLMSL